MVCFMIDIKNILVLLDLLHDWDIETISIIYAYTVKHLI